MSNIEMDNLGDPLLNDGTMEYAGDDYTPKTCGEKFRSKIRIVVGWREIATWDLWRAAIAELTAMVIFVFVGVGAVVSTSAASAIEPPEETPSSGSIAAGVSAITIIALTHGLAIAVLASSIGHLSGGHINPAVSFAMMVTGNISIVRGLIYMVVQIVAAALGAALLAACTPREFREDWQHALHTSVTPLQGFIIEVVLTFFLLFTIFANAVDKRGNSTLAPLFIGLAVATDHFMAVPLTGASMNPARSFGPSFIHGRYLDYYYVYWFGPLAGATGAAFVYRLLFQHGDQTEHSVATISKKLAAIERKLQ